MKKLSVMLAGASLVAAAAASPALAARGSDGNLKVVYWQAVSILNPYLSGGTKDLHGSSVVIEPLAKFNENGEIVPALVGAIPTLANGGIAADLKSVTWKLLPGLKWSDGSDFTAEDVVFTWQYCMAPGGGCQQSQNFEDVSSVEAVDAMTVKVTFKVSKPNPYGPFVGNKSPILHKAQFKDCMGAKAPECTAANFGPHGTGPFRVKDFKANDVVVYEANPYYRDPNKPAFATLTLKGGGDAASAARSVLETGEFDYAWNLLIEPEILATMEKAGKGVLISSFGSLVERIIMNPYAVDASLGAKRSTKEAGPHPFMADPAVRRALSLAIDRDLLVEAGYGKSGRATCNLVPAPMAYDSTGNNAWCLKQDLTAANKLLDDAGYKKGPDGIRAKNGVKLSVLYQTSTNSVRQATQALVKDMWAQIGVTTELRNISASVYFGSDPSSPDTTQKFYAEVEMYANNFDGTDPEKYLAEWTCDKIPTPQNGWRGQNSARYCNADYDALVAEYGKTADPAKRIEIAKKLNDKLTSDGAIMPLIHRGDVSARAKTLAGVKMNSWDSQLWNIADWSRAK